MVFISFFALFLLFFRPWVPLGSLLPFRGHFSMIFQDRPWNVIGASWPGFGYHLASILAPFCMPFQRHCEKWKCGWRSGASLIFTLPGGLRGHFFRHSFWDRSQSTPQFIFLLKLSENGRFWRSPWVPKISLFFDPFFRPKKCAKRRGCISLSKTLPSPSSSPILITSVMNPS